MARRYVKLTLDQEIDIVTRYEEGESHTAIGKLYNIAKGAILRVAHKHNAEIRSCGQPRKYVKNTNNIYQNLISVAKIGDKLPEGYYVYLYLRKSDQTPYYVGKGKGKGYRLWDTHTVKVPEDAVRIVIVEDNLTEIGAFARERELIRWYGRKDLGTGTLRNMTDGGEGISGYQHTDKAKQKISVASKAKTKHNKGKFAWSKNGMVQYNINCPGEGWIKGNALTIGRKFVDRPGNNKNTTWYNNGIEQRRCSESPGPEWCQGRLTASMQWWNNGERNTRALQCPGIGWYIGRLLPR